MATIGVGTGHFVLLYTELQGQGLLQTGRVEGCQRGQLIGLQTRVDQCGQSGNVGRVEDNDNMLHIGAILADVVTEVSGNFAIAFEQILTCHASLTRSTTRRNDVLSTCECLLGSLSHLLGVAHVLYCGSVVSHIGTGECALLNLIKYAMNTGLIDIVKANVRSKTEHQCALDHV